MGQTNWVGRLFCALGFHRPGGPQRHADYDKGWDEYWCFRGCGGVYQDDAKLDRWPL